MTPALEVDIACVGFGPAMAGFLHTVAEAALPLQVICYERADDIGFGVSGVVTRARGIRKSMPGFDPAHIPMAAHVTREKLVYMLDPVGASRRSLAIRAADRLVRAAGLERNQAVELPWIPPFLHKKDGLVLSIGQFLQYVGGQLMGSGAVQIWPASPVQEAIVEDGAVRGVRLTGQDMEVRAGLTVIGDGPMGAVGRQLGGPEPHEWALGMKFVVDLHPDTRLAAGTVLHTFGYPEPEIFGFLYVHPEQVATVGIFIPSWFRSPVRTGYRYLQHFLTHPYLWRHLRGGRLRSWGAKSIQEAGRRAEPCLVGDGFARIGEGSGSTNVLTGSGVDEAWTTGMQLGQAVVELSRAGLPLNRENLDKAYVERRRDSWVESEARIAEKARDGFHHGLIPGLVGMALAGLTKGRLWIPGKPRRLPDLGDYFGEEVDAVAAECRATGVPLHDRLMEHRGWPAIQYDGQLLISHQDALLMGGKVQAPPGLPDHVSFRNPDACLTCEAKVCIEMCSGQAIAPGTDGVPGFDREKCVFCGACVWNCEHIAFAAGAGGLHSSEN
jgi:electron-transferring-flavoprotein dehydrogenase